MIVGMVLWLYLSFAMTRVGRGRVTCVEISHYVSYVYYITLLCIVLLSLCFGFTCTPLTLLQLRYILSQMVTKQGRFQL